jgi:5-methylcytosine-specific restriction endonuclease McrA
MIQQYTYPEKYFGGFEQPSRTSQIARKLACRAGLWYNRGAKKCVSGATCNSPDRIRLVRRHTVDILYPHAENDKHSRKNIPHICWKCLQPSHQHNKSTDLCSFCHHTMLNRITRQKTRARKNGCVASLTAAQWAKKLYMSRGYCYYCRKHIGYKELAMEHKIPVTKGGGTTIENVVPACSVCNRSKGVEVRT